MRLIIILTIILCANNYLFSQVNITTTLNDNFSGYILDKDEKAIILRTLEGRDIKIFHLDIKKTQPLFLEVKLLNADIIVGRAIALDEEFIVIRNKYGTNEIARKNVLILNPILNIPLEMLDLQDVETLEGINRFEKYGNLKDTYWSFGLTYWGLNVLDIMLQYNYSEDFGIRLALPSILFNTDFFGIQLSHLYSLEKRKNVEINASGFIAFAERTNFDGYYGSTFNRINYSHTLTVGAGFDINLYGFYADMNIGYNLLRRYYPNDLTVIKIQNTDFNAIFRIGYVYRFNEK